MFGAFKQISLLSRIKDLWFGLFFLKAGLSLLIIIPFYLVNNGLLSSSLFSKTLINSWDFSVISEMFFGRSELISQYLIFVFIGAVIYVAIKQFINGGLYYFVVSGRLEKKDWREFFAECGLGFNIHIKITIMMIFVYILLLFAGMFFVNIIGMASGHLVGLPVLIMSGFKLLILALIILAASIFSDCARATATAYPEKSFREILTIASNHFKPSLRKLLILYIITYIPFFLFWLMSEWLSLTAVSSIGGLAGIGIELIFFQACSFTRTGQKLWYLICFGKDFRSKNQGRFLPEQITLGL
ncbi:MAG TPA: hypothetical protein ENL22_05830 [candidate division Zixibacteria bacterium]|nr:hypothetical protein [candidate division Zixibacteria bacterium]